jgi:two-component system sensor histidine kinase KdpD
VGWTVGRPVRAVAALALVAGVTYGYHKLFPVNATTVALSYLVVVLAVASAWGLLESILASLAGVLCFNYFFLPPVGTFTVADPENWVALFAFLVTSVVASQLSARAKQRALEATRRQQEMERLYELSRNLLLSDDQPAAGRVAYQIARAFDVSGVAFYDRGADTVSRAGARDVPVADERLRDVAVQGSGFHDLEAGATVLPVSLGGAPIGAIAILGGAISDTALHAIANLAAIEMERARSQAAAARADAARQNEELKALLLDALAHDFKTPLTSIKAAITALLGGARGDAGGELLTVIDEEADRLSALVTEAVQMARIEAGDVRLETSPQHVRDLVASALKKYRSALESRPLELELPDALPFVSADPQLAALALRQLIDNALKYSPPGSPVSIRAFQAEDSIVIAVADRGPGIGEGDRERIFERFYRAAHAPAAIPGTGMGLPIAREIAAAHEGRLWVESRPGGGSEFFLSLPCARQQDRVDA